MVPRPVGSCLAGPCVLSRRISSLCSNFESLSSRPLLFGYPVTHTIVIDRVVCVQIRDIASCIGKGTFQERPLMRSPDRALLSSSCTLYTIACTPLCRCVEAYQHSPDHSPVFP